MSKRTRRPGVPYEALEADALRDLAVGVALDPDSDPSHAMAAREKLSAAPSTFDHRRLTIPQMRELAMLLRIGLGRT